MTVGIMLPMFVFCYSVIFTLSVHMLSFFTYFLSSFSDTHHYDLPIPLG